MKKIPYYFVLTYLVSACHFNSVSTTTYTPYQNFDYASIHDYPRADNIEEPLQWNYSPKEPKEVVVPDSYHVSAYHAPISHKHRDNAWITHQEADHYTIQMFEHQNRAFVANQLLQMPKTHRSAEIQYIHDGRTYYKGIYGSFKTRAEAMTILHTLPEQVRTHARVESFHVIQNEEHE